MGKSLSKLEKRVGPEKLALFVTENPSSSQYRDYCAVSVALFEEILKLRKNEAGLLMRQLFSEK